MITVDHSAALLEVRGLRKSFAGVKALQGVDLVVRPGEVHCVLGQNGAGKSTLIKTLSGAYQPDSGEIFWQGEPVTIGGPVAALELGIATMYQELDVVDGLTIAENVFLGHEQATGGVLHVASANARTQQILARLGHSEISPRTEVGQLSAANKQIVSMARALSRDTKLIIMDEPSAVLDSQEVENLFRVVAELTEQGIAVVYISHRLAEIRRIGDRITVIKDGKTTASGLSVADTPTPHLIRLMTGREVANVFPQSTPLPTDAPIVLRCDALGVRGVFRNVSLEVRAGEIVGLAGLVGSGRSEILEAIYGARRSTSGTVTVNGTVLRPGSVDAAVSAGIGLSPEERKSQGLILDEPIFKNVTLSSFARFARGGFLREGAERDAARQQIEALELRPPDPNLTTRSLSGGNQQKILLARWLVHGTTVLLLDEPTRGVDVGARAEIYALIRRLAEAGTAIIVVSSEIDEVLGLADRVLVISDGDVLTTTNSTDIDEPGVLDLVMRGSAA
ncbi:sugar ABC transporter ATP-binding protein [Cryobacterium sp. TMT1-3]|uniref:Sugar ABC transporter ATP-binding protein n=1 Tax=Cryobacterium luteum TaxID=1424661 RepID=A0A1H8A9M3_9MICO|nr:MULTISPECIES: sugar ABC transporter ATP-binding protein [Cryobacterium]TFB88447.1 sugar ABC transporter ATP-binding protein [Cryobacterium luteum]TFC24473.1 sugar ABC transporter ATP-binding protein [Cryobacterium sp. TMT1-3]SEM67485.1 monosaccharide ABC transporter ATP-binding protein, CUT2 family [Cryobacterium luteum]